MRVVRTVSITAIALVVACLLVAVGLRVAASLRETADRDQVAPPSGRLIATRSGQVFVQDKGARDGPAIVLIHGTAAWSQLWWRTSDALTRAGYRVIAVDLPPFGYSDRPGNYTRADHAARIDDMLASLGLAQAVIVGHSFGAGTALEYVLRYKDRSRGLILVDAALGLTTPPSDTPLVLSPRWVRELLVSLTITNPLATRHLLSSLIARKEAANADNVAILQAPLARSRSTPDIADWLAYFTGSDPAPLSAQRDVVSSLSLPVALIWGDMDSVTPLDQARDLQTLLPRGRLKILPGLGHIPQIEDPESFNQALIESVEQLAAGPASR